MDKLIKMVETMKPFFEKVSNNIYLRAIRDGFVSCIPVILFSSLFILVACVPEIFDYKWPKAISTVLWQAYNYSMGMLGILMVATIAKSLTDSINTKMPKLRQINDYYWQKLAKASRFDPAEVIFVKRLLQVELDEECRRKMTDSLFKQYVTDDEAAFSRELYMNKDQMKCMLRHGMCIGSHGYDHYWLDSLTPEKQAEELDKSMDFLREIGVDMDSWVMCYPYGASNESLISLLKERGCKLGLTTDVAVANLSCNDVFHLPRLDTNDLPKDRNAEFPTKGRN